MLGALPLLSSSDWPFSTSPLAVAASLFVAVAGSQLLLWTKRLGEWSARPERRLLTRLRRTGWGIVGVSAGLAGLIVLEFTRIWLSLGPHGINTPEWPANVLMLGLLLIVLLAGWMATRVGLLEEPWESQGSPAGERFLRELRLLRRLGWGVVGSMAFIACLVLPVTFGLLFLVLIWAPVPFVKLQRLRQTDILSTLAVALKQQLPLPEELDELAKELGGQKRTLVQELAGRLREGESLLEALRHSRPLVSPHWLAFFEVAAQAGKLPEALQLAADEVVLRQSPFSPERTLPRVLIYFMGLTAFLTVLVGFLMYSIVPKYQAIYLGFKLALPESTRSLISLADIFVNALIGLPGIGMIFIVVALMLDLQLQYAWGRSLQEHWLWSHWFPRLNLPLFWRGLSLTVAAHRPLPQALAIYGRTHPMPLFRSRLQQVEQSVQQGLDIWTSLAQTRLITLDELLTLTRAQQTNTLAWALTQLGDAYLARLRYRAGLWARILQPVGVLLSAMMVGWIFWAFFEPLLIMLSTQCR